MVVSAYIDGDVGPVKTELINLAGRRHQCYLPDHPQRFGVVGFTTSEGPVVCGGHGPGPGVDKSLSHCRILKSSEEWSMWHNMIQKRSYALAIKINDQQTLILGGYDEYFNMLRSSEIMNDNGVSENSITAPLPLYSNCIIKLNNSMSLITAGFQGLDEHGDSRRASETWYLDLQTLDFTAGPRLQQRRAVHGCATLWVGGKIYGLVAGGFGSDEPYCCNILDTTEILDLQQPNPTWTNGMRHQIKLHIFSKVLTHNFV